MAEDRKSEHANRLHNLVDSLCEHQKKFLDDILALDQINFLNEYCRTNQVLGGRSFTPHENRIFSSSSIFQAGGCEKLPKGIEEEEIGPKTTTASAHVPPPVTIRKNQSLASKQKKIWSSLTSVFQAGGCEKLPKCNEEKKIVPKATAAPAHNMKKRTKFLFKLLNSFLIIDF
jgi:hypothetical protein